jgi:MFS superfamily sulfate permease-like transporter
MRSAFSSSPRRCPHIFNVPWLVYPLFALTIAIVLVMPRITTSVPAPLVAIIVVTSIVILGHLTVPQCRRRGHDGAGACRASPALAVPLDLNTLRIIWPTAISVAFVGLLETLLTAKLVDDLTDTRSHKGRESWALGIANIAAGFYGGIGGCAMIAQTVVNVKIGQGRTRISTAVAAIVLLVLVTALSDLMAQIPMVALAAVMMIAALKTIDWHSVRPATFRRMPIPETMVMVTTVAVTVVTGNLAIGIAVGVVLAMILFARRVAHVIRAERTVSQDGMSVHYNVHGPLFFGSSNDLVERFSYWRRPQARPDRSDPFPDLGCVERRGTGFDRNQVPRAWRDRHLHRARPAQFLVSPAADRSTWRVNCRLQDKRIKRWPSFIGYRLSPARSCEPGPGATGLSGTTCAGTGPRRSEARAPAHRRNP